MHWKMRIASLTAALGITLGGSLAEAATASADTSCDWGYTCIWDGTNFTGHKIVSFSTNSCFWLGNYNFGWVTSYKNNNTVDASIWNPSATSLPGYKARNLPVGGFSSNINIDYLGADGWLCLGSATPYY
ncbi:peptidase inhibitor family I36 protein [Actinacidiphila alni]|uniref:peptidase inhibitor family I36 protein n=1 Tax=Actinacidiphila alni TaxID=380248 RepID=UPI0033F173C9